MEIGYKIKALRERKNITRKHVALELGMTEEGYAKIECNEVDLNTEKLLKISQIIDVTLTDFFKNECSIVNNQHDFKDQSKAQGIVINHLPEKYIETLQDLVSSQKREIDNQKKEIEFLKIENESQKKEIEFLKIENESQKKEIELLIK
ncbi:MAG: XRE family transcriptional regulator [Cytophagales bacterium]|nr:MAG: XRE family transcriptional regulator [Cytophagales bacterium]